MDESEKSSSASGSDNEAWGSDKEALTDGEEVALDHTEEEAEENEPKTKTDELKPLGTPKSKRAWKKVELDCNYINVRGGFNTKYEPAPSIPFSMGRERHQFLQLCSLTLLSVLIFSQMLLKIM